METVQGIPRHCHCGSNTIVLTSKTRQNPGRRFFRCETSSSPGHLFKWVDEANSKELALLKDKQVRLDQDLLQLKQELLDMKKDIGKILQVLEPTPAATTPPTISPYPLFTPPHGLTTTPTSSPNKPAGFSTHYSTPNAFAATASLKGSTSLHPANNLLNLIKPYFINKKESYIQPQHDPKQHGPKTFERNRSATNKLKLYRN
ncbi:hypothetical protein YC2023_039073 [Brassica napus]